jgi:hypothetical protein
MRNNIFRLIVALLAFFVGAAGVWLSGLYPQIENYLVDKLSPSPELDPESKFISLADVCGAGHNSHTYLIMTSGETLERTGELFASPALANQSLWGKLNSASEIVERTPVLDETGQQVGERVAARFASTASILWTHNSVLASIDAPSLNLALEFESAFERR